MALLFLEGFDTVANSTDASLRGLTGSVSGVSWGSSTYSRGGAGYGAYLNASTDSFVIGPWTGVTTIVVGCAINIRSGAAGGKLFTLYEGGTAHCHVNWSGGRLLFYRYSSILLATASIPVFCNAWNFVEVKVTINDTTGSVVMNLNGQQVMSETGLDTRGGGTTGEINYIQFGGNPTQGCDDWYLDDVYVCDTSGSYCNDILGDCKVQTLRPDGNSSTSWTASAGSNYQCVDETTQNGDTDYVETSTATNQDLYTFGATDAATSTVHAVQIASVARKDDAGARSLKILTKSGGTTYNDGSGTALSTSYVSYKHIRETDPNTASAWTKSGVDGADFGVECV